MGLSFNLLIAKDTVNTIQKSAISLNSGRNPPWYDIVLFSSLSLSLHLLLFFSLSLFTFGQTLFPLSYYKAPSACFPHTWIGTTNKQSSLLAPRMNNPNSLSRVKYDLSLKDALCHWPVHQMIHSGDCLEFLLTPWLCSRASDCRFHRKGAATESQSVRVCIWHYKGKES